MRRKMRGWPSSGDTAPEPSQATRVVETLSISGGGRSDITNGKFVFSCTEAYRIRGGRIAEPVKGATLIGDGPTVLTRIKGIGNDLALDEGIGVCGKGGQSIPAGVGQPTLLIDGLTVGGTAA